MTVDWCSWHSRHVAEARGCDGLFHQPNTTSRGKYGLYVMSYQRRIPAEPLAVSIADAARLLNVSRPTIYILIERGQLRRARIGKAVRIPLADIHALLGIDDKAAS